MVALERSELGEIFIPGFLFLPAAPADAAGQDGAGRPDDDGSDIQRFDRTGDRERGNWVSPPSARPSSMLKRYSPFFAAFAPSFIASASLMYLPFFVLP